MGIVYALCGIAGFLSIFMVFLENSGRTELKYVLKTAASFCFVLAGIMCAAEAEDFAPWKSVVLTGLVLGMLGDIFLSSGSVVSEKKTADLLSLVGGAFFLLGHVAYAVWLLTFADGFNLWLLFLVFGLPALLLVLGLTGVFRAGKMLLPAAVYATLLGLMTAAAVNVYVRMPGETISRYVAAAGPLFAFSDLLLAWYNFGHTDKNLVKYVYMPAYYAAQLLFALTLAF